MIIILSIDTYDIDYENAEIIEYGQPGYPVPVFDGLIINNDIDYVVED